jgi:hypothetical protein
MKLAIIGSRNFTDYNTLEVTLHPLKSTITQIISVAAKGADTLGEQWAATHQIPTTIFPADWKMYGKKAGFIRNKDIIKNCDFCIAFWDGKSKGTAHSISLCQKLNKPYEIIYV